MAYLIPENIPSLAGVPGALQEVAAALRDWLGDEFTVWLEPEDAALGLAGSTPTLLLLHPKAGLLLIDAPGRQALGLRERKGILFRKKAAPELEAFRSRLVGETSRLNGLLDREGRLPQPFRSRSTLAVPDLHRQDALDFGTPPDQVDELLLAEDFKPDALAPAVARVLGLAGGAGLTEAQEQVVRGVVRPSIVIRDAGENDVGGDGQLVFRPPECAPEEIVRVLDREQERLAHHLGSGYRVVRGPAGCGKTLVLVYRAKFLAEHYPDRKYLLLCYNIPLSKALEAELAALPNVTVLRIDALAYDVAPGSRKTSDDWERAREQAATRLAAGLGPRHKYDAVFVDEAQDLSKAGLDLAFAALKEGREDFIIALDGAQNVFRQRARWNPSGMTARGRTTLLRKCYRNTKEIAEFAWEFLKSAQFGFVSDDSLDDPTLLVPPEMTSRRGPKPVVLQCATERDEITAVADAIEKKRSDGVEWSDMVVLYGHPQTQKKLYAEFMRRGYPYFNVNFNRQNKHGVVAAGNVLRTATFQILKGLEFSNVFVCGVNNIYEPGAGDDATNRRLVYVALTRAMDELMVTVSGRGAIGEALLAAALR